MMEREMFDYYLSGTCPSQETILNFCLYMPIDTFEKVAFFRKAWRA